MSDGEGDYQRRNLRFLQTFCPLATEIVQCYYIDGPGDWVVSFVTDRTVGVAYIERVAGTNWQLRQEYYP